MLSAQTPGAPVAARGTVARLVNASAQEIIWTSGATEGNNLAVKGAAQFYKTKGRHIITQKTEHKAVLDTCRDLERQGFEVTYLETESSGLVDLGKFQAAIRPDTILVSIMMVNNEIGVIQPIAEIGEICREKGIIFHCDAVQAAGKVDIDVTTLKVDLLTLTAHKMYGPKGIGALYVRRKPRVRIEAQMHGGGHERGMRSGTLPTHQIVGMGEAYRLAKENMAAENARIGALREPLPCWSAFTEGHVTAEGKLSACCFDATSHWTMGDLNKQSFMEAWNSTAFSNLRAAHLRKDVRGTVCENCLAYG